MALTNAFNPRANFWAYDIIIEKAYATPKLIVYGGCDREMRTPQGL